MFSADQRFLILKWGGLTLFALSLLPMLTHGIFTIVLFQYYLPFLIGGYAIYYSYTKARQINVTDQQVRNFIVKLHSRFKKRS